MALAATRFLQRPSLNCVYIRFRTIIRIFHEYTTFTHIEVSAKADIKFIASDFLNLSHTKDVFLNDERPGLIKFISLVLFV